MKMKWTCRILCLTALSLGPLTQGHGQGLSIEFTENKGQWQGGFQYRADLGSVSIFLHADGFTVLQNHEADYRRLAGYLHGENNTQSLATEGGSQPALPADGFSFRSEAIPEGGMPVRLHAYRFRFKGASPTAQTEGRNMTASQVNYYMGSDSTRWKSGVRVFQEVVYRNVYPNIDIRYYTYGGSLKYDLMVHPGADLSKVSMAVEGGVRWELREGELVTRTAVGETRQLKPYTYQVVDGQKREVACRYSLRDGQLAYDVKGYDPKQPLVIDPEFVFGSFTGSRANNWGYTATPGPDGSLFAGGIVFNQGYPTTLGAFQRNFGGGNIDIGITRFRPDGSGPAMYATYIGGSDLDIPHSLIADGSGGLIMLGRTSSTNYPRLSRHGPLGGMDIVVTKLDPTGARLIGSIMIGGSGMDGANESSDFNQRCGTLAHNYGDNARSEVVIDGANNVYVSTSTESADLPYVGGTFTRGGKQDALLVKLSPTLSTVTACVPFGGTENDAGFGIKLNPLTNEIYIAGATQSVNLPGSKPAVANPAHTIRATAGGNIDGFIAVFNNAGSSLLRSAYLGTSDLDIVYGIQFDERGFPYVMGISRGNWTVVNAAYSNAGSRQFISKLNPDLTSYVYSTVFGTSNRLPNMSPVAFLVDKCENVYVSGWGGKLTPCGDPTCFDANLAGTAGMPTTPDALYTQTDGRDFYIFVLQKDAASQLYGTFIGQLGGLGDHVDGGTSRFDSRGTIYQAVCGNCYGNLACPQPQWAITRPLPVRPGVVAPTNGTLSTSDPGCNLYAFKIKLDLSGVEAGVQSAINGVLNDTLGCVGNKVDFSDTLANGKTFRWDFGDGSPEVTTPDPSASYIYRTAGKFKVRLIAEDPAKCIPRDTSYLNMDIRNDPAVIRFDTEKQPPCSALAYKFVNRSTATKPFSSTSFVWDFGDGSPQVVAGTQDVSHTFPAPGTYNVRLILRDPSYCNENDFATVALNISPNVKADFELEDSVCAPYTAQFVNQSAGGITFTWTFSEGGRFVGKNPPDRNYTIPGTYTVKLVAEDPNTCNGKDSVTKTIAVGTSPSAAFAFNPPNPGVPNTPTRFTNLSLNATRYLWNFGDGDTSTTVNPVHQFDSTAQNNVCLVALNAFGCSDVVCQIVESRVEPLLDVPKAFSPNMDGKNDILYVRGYGITKMDFRIYNRWGQMVFRSTNPSNGWDGMYDGRIQPMEVYAYTLEAEFSDGQKLTRKGDVTLLR
jgi:gliding motility-associated-like protein